MAIRKVQSLRAITLFCIFFIFNITFKISQLNFSHKYSNANSISDIWVIVKKIITLKITYSVNSRARNYIKVTIILINLLSNLVYSLLTYQNAMICKLRKTTHWSIAITVMTVFRVVSLNPNIIYRNMCCLVFVL
jgi:hypothetical protein